MIIKENGYIDPYPHADLMGPCTLPCCEPDAYGPGPNWTCGCGALLMKPGLCVDCCDIQDDAINHPTNFVPTEGM